MFEIGNSLHEARVRQGIGLPAAEAATKIRAKYLKALEEEQFDMLPAGTYVKGFLRTYAQFLGLDGQLYVDEYSSRFVVGEDERRSLRPRRSSARPERRSGRFESQVVLVTLAAIAIVAALVIVAWKSGSESSTVDPSVAAPAAKAPAARTPKAAKPTLAHLVVTAHGGNAVLEVHQTSQSGRLLFQGTLLAGKSVPLTGKRLWLSADSPAHLTVRLNGRRVRIGRAGRPAVVLVTPDGVRRVAPS